MLHYTVFKNINKELHELYQGCRSVDLSYAGENRKQCSLWYLELVFVFIDETR